MFTTGNLGYAAWRDGGQTVHDISDPAKPVPIATMPQAVDRDYCGAAGTFGPHNLHENRPGAFQSEEVIFATCNNAGVRVLEYQG